MDPQTEPTEQLEETPEDWQPEEWAAFRAFERARKARHRSPYVVTEVDYEMYHSRREEDTTEKIVAAVLADLQAGLDQITNCGIDPERAAAATCDQAVWHMGRLLAVIRARTDGRCEAVRLDERP